MQSRRKPFKRFKTLKLRFVPINPEFAPPELANPKSGMGKGENKGEEKEDGTERNDRSACPPAPAEGALLSALFPSLALLSLSPRRPTVMKGIRYNTCNVAE